MAYLLKCFESGRKEGLEFPKREPATPTHFVMSKE